MVLRHTNSGVDELGDDGLQQVAEALVAHQGNDHLQQLTQQALKVQAVPILVHLHQIPVDAGLA